MMMSFWRVSLWPTKNRLMGLSMKLIVQLNFFRFIWLVRKSMLWYSKSFNMCAFFPMDRGVSRGALVWTKMSLLSTWPVKVWLRKGWLVYDRIKSYSLKIHELLIDRKLILSCKYFYSRASLIPSSTSLWVVGRSSLVFCAANACCKLAVLWHHEIEIVSGHWWVIQKPVFQSRVHYHCHWAGELGFR